ncbi:MAG TPA: hypothetical protein VF598_01650 [Hymenobacter sp.]|jgi:hypothetical protein
MNDIETLANVYTKTGAGPVLVAVPELWPEIEQALIAAGVYDSEHLAGVYLTGSAITRTDAKDIDVMLVLHDQQAWQAEALELPKEIGGKPVSYHLYDGKLSPLYPALDCSNGILHLPLISPISYVAVGGATIETASYDDWTPQHRAHLHRLSQQAYKLAEKKWAEAYTVAQARWIEERKAEALARAEKHEAERLANPSQPAIAPRNPCGKCSRASREQGR